VTLDGQQAVAKFATFRFEIQYATDTDAMHRVWKRGQGRAINTHTFTNLVGSGGLGQSLLEAEVNITDMHVHVILGTGAGFPTSVQRQSGIFIAAAMEWTLAPVAAGCPMHPTAILHARATQNRAGQPSQQTKQGNVHTSCPV
jgi:hypothetical protein